MNVSELNQRLAAMGKTLVATGPEFDLRKVNLVEIEGKWTFATDNGRGEIAYWKDRDNTESAPTIQKFDTPDQACDYLWEEMLHFPPKVQDP